MLLSLLLLGCPFVTDADWKAAADRDGDGFLAVGVEGGDDCDDGDPAVFPGQAETCNGLDDDCDPASTDPTSAFYADADGDGFGDINSVIDACEAPEGYTTDTTDCDDTDGGVKPGAEEACDGADNNCDGVIDDGLGGSTFYADTDGDGFGDANETIEACVAPEGYVEDATDCDDGDDAVAPDADERCNGIDDNCDGETDGPDAVDTVSFYQDDDADGYGNDAVTTNSCDAPAGYVELGGDCDDTSASFSPGAPEVCDGWDNNCDGAVDEDGAIDAVTSYADADGDGYGDPATAVAACTQPAGYILDNSDCDDADAGVNPVALETCDGVDQDCDGSIDDGATDQQIWYTDADGDGVGDAASSVLTCTPPANTSLVSGDCDDADGTRYPGAPETCNNADDDCDAEADEDAADALTWYADADSDGFGDPATAEVACAAPSGSVADNTDCDDDRADAYPGGLETCDGLDQDCDGAVDNDTIDLQTYYTDADGDGYGDPAAAVSACEQPDDAVENDDDCDDTDNAVNPDAQELCGGGDEDCDGLVDAADRDAVLAYWYRDADNDGFGEGGDSVEACDAPAGYVALSGDCDDGTDEVSPEAAETCNDRDDDCDGTLDEDATDATVWYGDTDGDTYGNPSVSTTSCDAPTGYQADALDCDDSQSGTYPGAAEVCDDDDNDCDGSIDEGVTTTSYADADGDGHGDPAELLVDCGIPGGYVASSDDCDDSDAEAYPGNTEVCDNSDNDCDGTLNFGISVPDDYADLSDAVAAAITGDHVCVAAGTYVDTLNITAGIILEGWEGSASTIIDGDDVTTVVKLDDAPTGTTLRGFTLLDGSDDRGGGLQVENTDAIIDDVVIDSATCAGNLDCKGAAVLFEYDASVVTNLTIRGSSAAAAAGSPETFGGAVALDGSVTSFTDLWIEDMSVELTKNAATTRGAAIYAVNSTTSFDRVEIIDTIVFERSTGTTNTTLLEGLIYVNQGTADFSHLRISGTSIDADQIYGGIFNLYANPSGVTLSNVAVLDSTVGNGVETTILEGAVMHVGTGTPVSLTNASIVTTDFSAPASTAIKGGVFYFSNTATFTGINLDVSDTTASATATNLSGGVYYADASSVVNLSYSNFYDNPETVTCATCLAVTPGYTSVSGAADTWDLTLAGGSGLINTGSVAIDDANGSRSDIGAMGGPEGDDW